MCMVSFFYNSSWDDTTNTLPVVFLLSMSCLSSVPRDELQHVRGWSMACGLVGEQLRLNTMIWQVPRLSGKHRGWWHSTLPRSREVTRRDGSSGLLFRLILSAKSVIYSAVFFSYNKSTNSTFNHNFFDKRTNSTTSIPSSLSTKKHSTRASSKRRRSSFVVGRGSHGASQAPHVAAMAAARAGSGVL